MNKLIIALSVACASACVFAADNATVGATPSKVITIDWFSAKVESDGAKITRGNFEPEGDKTTAPIFDKENKKIVIDSELDKPVTFKADSTDAKDMATVNFALDTAIVPNDSLKSLEGRGAKVAFAASEDANGATKGYYAWLGSEWVLLSGATPVEEKPYTLTVTFDNRDSAKRLVQFKVGETILKSGDVEWLTYTADAVKGTLSIDLVGSGNVASFVGNQVIIEAEVVVSPDCGQIEVNESDMAAFRATTPVGQTVDEFIASDAQKAFGTEKFAAKGISVGAAYALGLVDKDANGKMAPVEGGVLKAKAVAQSGSDDGIKLDLNVKARTDTGTTVDYYVVDERGGETKGLVIPKEKLAAGLQKFKVQAIVAPAVAN